MSSSSSSTSVAPASDTGASASPPSASSSSIADDIASSLSSCTINNELTVPASSASPSSLSASSSSSSSSAPSSPPSSSSSSDQSVHSTPLSSIDPSFVPPSWTVSLPVRYESDGVTLSSLQHASPSLTVTRINSTPLMIRVADFMSADECASIIALAHADNGPVWKPYRALQYEPTIDPSSGEVTAQSFKVKRTDNATLYQLDYGHYIAMHPMAYMIADRISAIVNLPSTRASNLRRLLRYRPGEEFLLHADDYDRLVPLERGRRMLTCLIYIDTPASESGGGTVFPHLDSGSYRSPPTNGSLLIFRNFDPMNEMKYDDRCKHYAETTTIGEKYAINMYVVEKDGVWWN